MASEIEVSELAGISGSQVSELQAPSDESFAVTALSVENNASATSTVVRELRKGQKSAEGREPIVEDTTEGDALLDAAQSRWSEGLDWPIVLWIGALHVGALSGLYFFTWKALALAFVLAWVTGGLGICLGYHRCLTHGSFNTYRPVRWLLAFLGGLAGEGSAITWVSVHRKHHVFSDKEGDPHSPHDGAWWSHMLWLGPNKGKAYFQQLARRYSPDLLKDPGFRFLDRTFMLWHFVVGFALFAIGYYGWDTYTAWSFVAWGVFVRFVWVLHVTWFVNSASHMWGYRNYETTDDSRNLWWVGLLAYGEGWHNNHHAFQRMAKHGHKWWEFDVTYWAILAMEKVGLAWDVVHEVPAHRKAA